MISVIIPTLLKVDRLQKSLIELSLCDVVGEIILIDNSENNKIFNIPKLVHILEHKNTYVNPAWNKGVSIAKYEKICILNDDTWFDWSELSNISKFIKEDVGMIGMSPNNWDNQDGNLKLYRPLPDGKTAQGFRPNGFGCCFFIHKKNWDPIPEDLKIWAGDDWLFYRSKKPNYILEGLKCGGHMSFTSDDITFKNEFDQIKQNDMINMRSYVQSGVVENYLIGTIWW